MPVGTTHNVRIGTHDYLVMPGTYRKRQAPMFGARFATGDPDYSNLTVWQHWVQSCWVGGFGADTWTDDSMYFEGAGVDATKHEMLTLSRELGPLGATRTTGNWTVGGTVYDREFFGFNSKLYILVRGGTTDSKVYRYNDGTDDWTLIKTFTESVRGVCVWSGKVWFGDGGASLSFMNPDETFGTKAKPAGRTEVPYSMCVFRDRMYVGFGRFIWRMKPDESWDGSTVFYEAIGVTYLVSMEPHLGFLYMGSQNGKILRTDGNSTFDLWGFDLGVSVASMRSYDGKLFVSTTESETSSSASSGVLYQFTGSAVTELKRWGVVGRDTAIRRMRVAFRKLFFGGSNVLGNGNGGFGIAAYDAVEDAYNLFATYRDTTVFAPGTNGVNNVVDDIAYWNGYLFCSVRGHGVFKTRLTFHDYFRDLGKFDISKSAGAAGFDNGGWVESSDFDAGTPGLIKYFRQITIHVDLPHSSHSVYVETSNDGGKTWTFRGTVTKTSAATRYRTTFGIRVKATRLKYRLTLRSTDGTRTPAVLAVSTQYLPMPDPCWMWDMTLVLAQRLHLLDNTDDVTVDPAVEATYLDGLQRAGTPIAFTDVDGTVYDGTSTSVLIYDYYRDIPNPGPTSEGPLEGFVRITLLESSEGSIPLS